MSLQTMAGAKASNDLGSFIDKFTAHSKPFFATNLLFYAAKSLNSLGNSAWSARGSARGGLRDARLETCHRPLKELLTRSAGKSLAQGQVSFLDPT